MTNTITESLFLADRQKQRNTGQSTLDQDAFLRLLITQLQNQDPLNPMEDKEFIAQMAQFTSLEQMTQMNKSLTHFINLQADVHFLNHNNLLGKKVKWEKTTPDETSAEVQENLVKAIKFQNGKTKLVLENNEVIDSIQVIQVSTNNN